MNKTIPLISIIVPNYNHERFLKQRLETVFKQTYTDFDVILLDDCSTDNSQSILLEYARHPKVSHCVFNEVNSGSPFKQWQKGIALAKGEYIWIAESDDYCELNFLEKMISVLAKQPLVGLGYCQTSDVNEKGEIIHQRIKYTQVFKPNIWCENFQMKGRQFIDAYLSFFNVIPNASAVLFKRDLVDASFFSESLLQMKMCGDWFFWIQLALKSKVMFEAETLNYFRNHNIVSRNHKTLPLKKTRLLEEKYIREFMLSVNFANTAAILSLYKKWFQLFNVNAVFSNDFYIIKFKKHNSVFFIGKFLSFKWSQLM